MNDDGTIAFYEYSGTEYKVALWTPNGNFKVGTVPRYDDKGAPLFVVGINSEGMLAGNSLGFDQYGKRTVGVAFRAIPGWSGSGAVIDYPFRDPNEECFNKVDVALCGDPQDIIYVKMSSEVAGVSRMGGPWGTATGFASKDYACKDCCGVDIYNTMERSIYFTWPQVFYGDGTVTPGGAIIVDDIDPEGMPDGDIDQKDLPSARLVKTPSEYPSTLIDVSFDGTKPYAKWESSPDLPYNGPPPTPIDLGTGFEPGQYLPASVEQNKTNDAPQAAKDDTLVTTSVAQAQDRVPTHLQSVVKIKKVIDNANGGAILAEGIVYKTEGNPSTGSWSGAGIFMKDGKLHIVQYFENPRQASASEMLAADKDGDLIMGWPTHVEVLRPQNFPGTWMSEDRRTVSNILSVWDMHPNGDDWIQVRVKIPESLSLPEDSIVWTVGDSSVQMPNNARETPRLRWPSDLRKHRVTVDFPTLRLKKYVIVDVPDIGAATMEAVTTRWLDQRLEAGGHQVAKIGIYSIQAGDWSESLIHRKLSEKNALKHAYWAAMCSSDVGIGKQNTLDMLSAYEVRDKMEGNPASEATMDMYNNRVGANVQLADAIGEPSYALIQNELIQSLQAGGLMIWDGPAAEHAAPGLDILIKSDNTRYHPEEERY